MLTEIGHDRSNAEIAARPYLREATVQTHVTRTLTKLALRDRAQAVVVAARPAWPDEGAVEA